LPNLRTLPKVYMQMVSYSVHAGKITMRRTPPTLYVMQNFPPAMYMAKTRYCATPLQPPGVFMHCTRREIVPEWWQIIFATMAFIVA
jgi:hypothetical protein